MKKTLATEITTELVNATYSTKKNYFNTIDKITSVKIGERKVRLSSVLDDINSLGVSTFSIIKTSSKSKVLDFINLNIDAFLALYPENYFTV